MFKDKFCSMDGLIVISYDDIIETVSCNEKVIDESTVRKVFKEILDQQIKDAKYSIEQHMEKIIAEVKKNRD